MATEYDEILDFYDILYVLYEDFYNGNGAEPFYDNYDALGDYFFLGQGEWYGGLGGSAFTDGSKSNFSQSLLRRAKFDKLVGFDRAMQYHDYNRKDFYDLEKESISKAKSKAISEKTRYINSKTAYETYTVKL